MSEAEKRMRKLVREHVLAGGDPHTPPKGVSAADLEWIGWGLDEATRLSFERAGRLLNEFPVPGDSARLG